VFSIQKLINHGQTTKSQTDEHLLAVAADGLLDEDFESGPPDFLSELPWQKTATAKRTSESRSSDSGRKRTCLNPSMKPSIKSSDELSKLGLANIVYSHPPLVFRPMNQIARYHATFPL
jgi:hypothetical protein